MREAWRLLRANHPELIEDVTDGKRFVWLGSGISLKQVPGLARLIRHVLLFLRDQAASGNPDAGEHREALIEILDTYLQPERKSYDADQENWAPANLDHVVEKYSSILGVGVAGKSNDYLLIEGAGLPTLYGAPEIEPGPTHRMLAMLISEGVVTNLASGNWDGLVEKALCEISASDTLLDVYVDVADPRNANGHAEIAKFHGCAVLTLRDPARYRDKIIATNPQISSLHSDPAFAHMRDHLRDRTTRTRSLVLGLSVQDSDLLAIIRASTSSSPWPWDPGHPAYLFAEPEMLQSQKDVLEVAYGATYGAKRKEIVQQSALGSYAGPVVAALLLEVIASKFMEALRQQTSLPTTVENELAFGIRSFVQRIVIAFGSDETSFANFLTGEYSDFLRTYLGPSTVGDALYVPFARGTRGQLRDSFAVAATGVDLLALALGLIGHGEKSRRWRISLHDDGAGTRMLLSRKNTTDEVTLIIVRGAREAIAAMTRDDWISDNRTLVMLQMEVGHAASTRSPGGRIGRGRKPRSRQEVAWSDIADSVTDVDDLLTRFETGAGI